MKGFNQENLISWWMSFSLEIVCLSLQCTTMRPLQYILDEALFRMWKLNVLKTLLQLSCCGADTYTDWYRSLGWKKHTFVPDSCCTMKHEGCGEDKSKINKKVRQDMISNLQFAFYPMSFIPTHGTLFYNCVFLLRVVSGLSSSFCLTTWCQLVQSAWLLELQR